MYQSVRDRRENRLRSNTAYQDDGCAKSEADYHVVGVVRADVHAGERQQRGGNPGDDP
jgi:hypothetical protein